MSSSAKQSRKTKEPLSRDPLITLGQSLFLQILSNLPFTSILTAERVCESWRDCVASHSRTIWRARCLEAGAESKHINMMDSIDIAMKSGWHGYEPGYEEPEPEPEAEKAGNGADWRAICKTEVELDRNWRFGRCRERWVTMPGNAVWRIKVDEEQGTMISTSRTGGLHVVDLKSSKPLFSITGVRPYAHLEQTKGFVIFDLENSDFALTAYRTQHAIKRSAHPTPPPNKRSALSKTAISYTYPGYDPVNHVGPLPNGHLTYYRTIKPLTKCGAFRARLDHEGVVGKERAVLGMAGKEAVYLVDLDNKEKVETIKLSEDQEDIQYIEFDEDYVYLCSQSHLNIYSRQSPSSPVVRFPPVPLGNFGNIPVVTDFYDVTRTSLVPHVPIEPAVVNGLLSKPVPVSRANLSYGAKQSIQLDSVPPLGTGPVGIPDFCAVHFTRTDLIILSRNNGMIWVIREYRKHLNPSLSSAHQEGLLRDHAICINIGQSVEHLAVHGTRVAIITAEEVLFFDTSTLPNLPLEANASRAVNPDVSTISIHSVRSITGAGIANASCVQMDRRCIYVTYRATTDAGIGGVLDMTPGSKHRFVPPSTALRGMAMCIRAWDFGEVF